MKLKKLIKDLDLVVKGSKEIDITGLSNNSKTVAPGYLYIAKRGKSFDGNDFVQNAILGGASCILTDLYNPFIKDDVVQLIAKDVASFEPELAKRFYEDPSNELFMVGITGTNGKTTTSYLVKHLFDTISPTGLMGSIEKIIGEKKIASDLTTPDCITCNKCLREMIVHGEESACMEVSSHALAQARVQGILYDVAIFTNLTPEHLDYHASMEEYASEKKKLFSIIKKGGVMIANCDSPWFEFMKEGSSARLITYGLGNEGDYRAKHISMSVKGTTFVLVYPKGEVAITIPLVGRHNVYNALAAIASAVERGVAMSDIQKRFETFPPVLGRLQLVSEENHRTIFVDHAHKPDALENVLKTLSEIPHHNIITVFGCGGDRDKFKRPKMAAISEYYSDIVVVTSDNPRSEDPISIIEEICVGFTTKRYIIEPDRRVAIEKAISLMNENDILLIAGKGHETHQIFQSGSIPFDDVKVAKEFANAIT